MNLALLATFATGLIMYDEDDSKVSNLGTMIIAGLIVATAAKGGK